jgi:excisionase family DNA binding protein
MADRLLTTKEVAHLLAVTTSWLNQAASSGDVPAYRVGGGWRFDVNELGRVRGGATA